MTHPCNLNYPRFFTKTQKDNKRVHLFPGCCNPSYLTPAEPMNAAADTITEPASVQRLLIMIFVKSAVYLIKLAMFLVGEEEKKQDYMFHKRLTVFFPLL